MLTRQQIVKIAKSHAQLIIAQQRWIESHGRTLAGYVARYGSKNDPEHFGDGGEAIYAADCAELAKLEGGK
jgi:hypothetical protein